MNETPSTGAYISQREMRSRGRACSREQGYAMKVVDRTAIREIEEYMQCKCSKKIDSTPQKVSRNLGARATCAYLHSADLRFDRTYPRVDSYRQGRTCDSTC